MRVGRPDTAAIARRATRLRLKINAMIPGSEEGPHLASIRRQRGRASLNPTRRLRMVTCVKSFVQVRAMVGAAVVGARTRDRVGGGGRPPGWVRATLHHRRLMWHRGISAAGEYSGAEVQPSPGHLWPARCLWPQGAQA